MSRGRKKPRIQVRIRPEDARALVARYAVREAKSMVKRRSTPDEAREAQAAARVIKALSQALIKWDARETPEPGGYHHQSGTGGQDE